MNNVEFILFVNDQNRSREFYSTLLQSDPVLDVSGMTEFRLTETSKLGLLVRENAGKILENEKLLGETGNNLPGCELYLYVDNPGLWLRRAVDAGAFMISEPKVRDWGDIVAYCNDPDGHVIAFARTIR